MSEMQPRCGGSGGSEVKEVMLYECGSWQRVICCREKLLLIILRGIIMSENNSKQYRVYLEDHEKFTEFMSENNFSSNSEFMHFVAENLSLIKRGATAHPDGEKGPDGSTVGSTDKTTEAALVEETAKIGSKDGILVNGKFYPVIFPNESWEAEDRYYYFHWVGDNINRLLRFDLQKAFDDMRTWATDHDGQPKEKTPYGYFTKKYLTWHTWPVYPELWPNLPSQRVIFPECQEDDYQEALRRRHHDPFAGTNLRHRDKHFI